MQYHPLKLDIRPTLLLSNRILTCTRKISEILKVSITLCYEERLQEQRGEGWMERNDRIKVIVWLQLVAKESPLWQQSCNGSDGLLSFHHSLPPVVYHLSPVRFVRSWFLLSVSQLGGEKSNFRPWLLGGYLLGWVIAGCTSVPEDYVS